MPSFCFTLELFIKERTSSNFQNKQREMISTKYQTLCVDCEDSIWTACKGVGTGLELCGGCRLYTWYTMDTNYKMTDYA